MGSSSSIPSSPANSQQNGVVKGGSLEEAENLHLQAGVARLKIEVSRLEAESADLQAAVKKKSTALKEARSSLKTAAADRKKLREEIWRLKNGPSSSRSENDKEDQTDLENRVAELKRQLSKKDKQKAVLESRLKNVSAETDAREEVDVLRAKVASLEETLVNYEQITSPGHMATKARREFFPARRYQLGERVVTKLGYSGVVRFCGEVRFATGTWVGLELDNQQNRQRRQSGTANLHNGEIQGVSYFSCPDDFGLFVRAEDVVDVLADKPTMEVFYRERVKAKPFAAIVLAQVLFRRYLARRRAEKKRLVEARNVDFKDMDEYAMSAPSDSIASLAKSFKKQTRDERSLARFIFSWITSNVQYDADAYFSGDQSNDDVDTVFRIRRCVCGGFSKLFKALAKAVGLDSHIVTGYSKGYGYRMGDSFEGKKPSHAWNVVKVNGQWHPVDVTWASGYINDKFEFTRRFSDYYFLTPPNQFILDHFPVDEDWQLLPEPINLSQFELTLKLSEPYFENRLAVVSHPNAVIEVGHKGEIEVTFRNPENALLLARLLRLDANENGKTTKTEIPLGTFVQTKNCLTTCMVPFPKPGRYELRFYVKNRTVIGSFSHFTDYKITCHNVKRPYQPFPEVFNDFSKAGGYLLSPLAGVLKPSKTISFMLELAEAVQVVVQPGWKYLKRAKGQESEFTWTGELVFKDDLEGVSLFAQFEEGSSQYKGILRYKMDGSKTSTDKQKSSNRKK
eukprot:m.188831 g.188831  ORF g.188831 m.188831 type:complete len:738 (+) comp39395_c0_seq2:41-2254(+)